MSIDRKRRIFRASSIVPVRTAMRLRPTLLAGALAVVAIGGLALLSRPSALFGHAPLAATVLQAEAPSVAVVDAATLRLADNVVRLRGVVAPARGRLCRSADGRGFDCGAAAAEALAGLVRDRAVACRLDGRDASGLREATCEAGGAELNRAVIAAGWARAQGAAPELHAAENAARAAGRGLWQAAGGAASF